VAQPVRLYAAVRMKRREKPPDPDIIVWRPVNDLWRPCCPCDGLWSVPDPDDGVGPRCDMHRLAPDEHRPPVDLSDRFRALPGIRPTPDNAISAAVVRDLVR
jgi:hypothetical protein